jgi:hypothetical protein
MVRGIGVADKLSMWISVFENGSLLHPKAMLLIDHG